MDILLKNSNLLKELFLNGECLIRNRDEETLDHLVANTVLRGINYRVTELNTNPDFYTEPNAKKFELIDKQKGIEAYEYMEKHKFGDAGLGEVQVGYIFEKKTGSDAGSRFMVIAIQKYKSPGLNSVVAILSNGAQINVGQFETEDYRFVGRLNFESAPSYI